MRSREKIQRVREEVLREILSNVHIELIQGIWFICSMDIFHCTQGWQWACPCFSSLFRNLSFVSAPIPITCLCSPLRRKTYWKPSVSSLLFLSGLGMEPALVGWRVEQGSPLLAQQKGISNLIYCRHNSSCSLLILSRYGHGNQGLSSCRVLTVGLRDCFSM